jgi:hypothetical protein
MGRGERGGAVAEMARVLLPRSSADGCLAMLTGYFDDSGTHDQSPVVVFGGIIGREIEWQRFEVPWRAKLQAPLPGKPPLRRFHMTDCMARSEEFAGYSEAERDAVIHDFRQIIINSGVMGYAVGVSRRDWQELIVPPLLYVFGDAEMYCFRDCVSKMVTFVDLLSKDDKQLSLVFDNRPHRTEANKFVYEQYQRFPSTAQLCGLSFLSSDAFVPLQGADMFAWEFFNFTRKLLADDNGVLPRPHARQFFDSGRFHMGLVDRATCEKIALLLGVKQA